MCSSIGGSIILDNDGWTERSGDVRTCNDVIWSHLRSRRGMSSTTSRDDPLTGWRRVTLLTRHSRMQWVSLIHGIPNWEGGGRGSCGLWTFASFISPNELRITINPHVIFQLTQLTWPYKVSLDWIFTVSLRKTGTINDLYTGEQLKWWCNDLFRFEF